MYYSNDQIMKKEMGVVCGTYGGQSRPIQVFGRGKLTENERFEDAGVGRKTILKWIFRKWDGGHGLNRAGSGCGQVTGTCECGNEPSGSIKCGEILD